MKSYYFVIISAFILLAMSLGVISCAVEAAPLGGPKDSNPPLPDSLRSTANKQLFFEKQEITLVFDEWIKLANQNQIIVSPPLEYPLDVKMKGKKIIVRFDQEEELKPQTTYTINFGQSIVDYTENNPMGNYTHVFSTGAYIDSLSIQGKVLDDFSGEPRENIMVALYDDLRDSAIFDTRPLYFTRTDENGNFSINNIRQDSFRLFALDDKNLNFYKDQENEEMGFLDSIIYLDTAFNQSIKLGLFLPEPELRITEKKHQYGFIKLGLNKPITNLEYAFNPALNEYTALTLRDSFFIWYRNIEDRDFIYNVANDLKDTIGLILYEDELSYDKTPKIVEANASNSSLLGPLDTLILKWNQPLLKFNKIDISVRDTSSTPKNANYFIDQRDPRILKVHTSWLEGIKYSIQFLPEAVQGFHEKNRDSLSYEWIVGKSANFGEIVFELDSLNTEYRYIVELTRGNNTKFTKFVEGKKRANLRFHSLEPGKFEAKVFEDVNKNGRWDPGSYIQGRFSEKWVSKKLETLKANWTLQVKVDGFEF